MTRPIAAWPLVLTALLLSAQAHAVPAVIPWIWDGGQWPRGGVDEAAVVVDDVLLRGATMTLHPGSRRGDKPAALRVTPVVHVEMSQREPPQEPERFHDAIRDLVLFAATRSTSGWVQLDLEARPSQRVFYQTLVRDLHQRLGGRVRLSVTALAWWCGSRDWLDPAALPADEVVPMFFRMGREAARYRDMLVREPGRLDPRCRGAAIGSSTAEPLSPAALAPYTRRYVFNGRRPWPATYVSRSIP
jgi:hypothetical protein